MKLYFISPQKVSPGVLGVDVLGMLRLSIPFVDALVVAVAGVLKTLT